MKGFKELLIQIDSLTERSLLHPHIPSC